MKRSIAIVIVILLLAGSEGQNQVPPGLRKPPFIVVPPVGEKVPSRGVNSARREAIDQDNISDLMVPENNNRPLPNMNPGIVVPPLPDRGPQPPVRGPPSGPSQGFPPPDRRPPPSDQRPAPRQPPPVREPPLPARGPPPVMNNKPNIVPHPDGGRPFNQRPLQPKPVQKPPSPPSPGNGNKIPQSQQISQQCFNCLCMAASGCDSELRCVSPSANSYFCGKFHISWAYWADSGKPEDRPEDPGAWEECLLNDNCAQRTIQGYMNKFAVQDCNGDGVIDCVDYARIHKAGPPPNCQGAWIDNTEFWKRFTACWGVGQGKIDLRSGG